MAYRLKKDEPVAKGLKRIVRKELKAAADQLDARSPSDRAIHEARKSIKKARAVLQIVGDRLDADATRDQLRLAAHLLAPLRNADAVAASARSLEGKRGGRLPAKARSALRQLLARDKARLTARARRGQSNKQAVRLLEQARKSADDLPWKKVTFSNLSSGIRKVYKRARADMRKARASNRSEKFHEWRKRVKTLWYALRLLELRTPLRRQRRELKRLEAWLGDDHNLLVLRTEVLTKRGRTRQRIETPRVRRLAERKQQQIRKKALRKGARLLKDRPKQFGRRLHR